MQSLSPAGRDARASGSEVTFQQSARPQYWTFDVEHWRLSMRIDIITLFPEICRAPLNESMMKRAQENGALDLRIHNLRAWTSDKHHVVDDAPFGGGQGMVMKPEPIFAAVEDLRKSNAEHQRNQYNPKLF